MHVYKYMYIKISSYDILYMYRYCTFDMNDNIGSVIMDVMNFTSEVDN